MKYTNQIILLAIIIGASIRLTVYLQNRSFIIDEANLARNIVEKSYSDFIKPLDYEQYAPPVLSCALKLAIKLGGVNEDWNSDFIGSCWATVRSGGYFFDIYGVAVFI